MMAPNEAYVTLAIDVAKEPAVNEESLLSKFGGEEKVKLLVEKLQSELFGNTDLCPYYSK